MKQIFDCPPTNIVINVYDGPWDAYSDALHTGVAKASDMDSYDYRGHYAVYCKETSHAFVGLCLENEDFVDLAGTALDVAFQIVSDQGVAPHAEEDEAVVGVMKWVLTCLISAGADFSEMGSGRLNS